MQLWAVCKAVKRKSPSSTTSTTDDGTAMNKQRTMERLTLVLPKQNFTVQPMDSPLSPLSPMLDDEDTAEPGLGYQRTLVSSGTNI